MRTITAFFGALSLAYPITAATWPALAERSIQYAAQKNPAAAVQIGPKGPFKPMPLSSPRTKECQVKSNGGSVDDSENILAAIKECNDGGKVTFAKGSNYMIGKALDLTKLKSIDLNIQGTIKMSSNTGYWAQNAFRHTFQNAVTFFNLGGTDVNVYGGGTLDGSGGAFKDGGVRPILFGTIGLKGGVIKDLNLRNSPQWFNLVRNSEDVVFHNININGHNKNTDGWDTLDSKNIVIQHSVINNGDDCISFKPGSVGIVIQGLSCTGSHGISVGSLGQYRGKTDIVENVYVGNITMSNASNGARIKTWAASGQMSGVGSGGGGSGRVNNVTYEGMRVSRVDYAVEITQCYGQKDMAACRAGPSKVAIENIHINGISGTTSGKHDSVVASFTCSSTTNCKNISVRDLNVRSPNGGRGVKCNGVKPSGVSC